MPIVDGVRVITRINRVSQARQHEIAEHWRAIERERARKRLARALKIPVEDLLQPVVEAIAS